MKERLISALASIPIVAAMTMSGACAATCPYGMVNDPYPGQCSRYIDINVDGICDFSQATATASDQGASTTYSDPQSSENSGSAGFDVHLEDGNNVSSLHDDGFAFDNGQVHSDGTGYFILPVSILLISAYLFTHYLFSKGIINRQRHRRFWNLFVTAGYLGTGVTGVLLIFIINLGVRTVLNPNITFLHAELAILMVVGTMIHIHLYWKPFKKIFKVLFNLKSYSNKKKHEKVPRLSE